MKEKLKTILLPFCAGVMFLLIIEGAAYIHTQGSRITKLENRVSNLENVQAQVVDFLNKAVGAK